MRARVTMKAGARAALLSAVTLAGTSVHCGGRVDSLAGNDHGDGRGANGKGIGGSGYQGGTGSSGTNEGGAGGSHTNGDRDGGAGDRGGTSGAGGPGSGGDWRSGRPWPLATGGLPEPPSNQRGWERLDQLQKLRMDEDLSVLAPEDCPTTFFVDWDLDRDGTVDATERRIFDARGRLVAAELSGVRPEAGNPRRRVLIEYDEKGRPTQHVYGGTGTGEIRAHVAPCAFEGAPRGSVVDIAYHASGRVNATVVRNDDICESPAKGGCQAIEFDERGRLVRRRAICPPPDADPKIFEQPFDEWVDFDDSGRATTHTVLSPLDVASTARYRYPAPDTVEISWTGQLYRARSLETLTRTLDSAGRVTAEVRDIESNGSIDERLTRTFDGDDCGYETRVDYGDDGVVDLTSKTSCTDRRVTSLRDRNMVAGDTGDFGPADSTLAPPQGTASVDVSYDPAGFVVSRAYETTSEARASEPIYDRGTFTYADGFGKSGGVDRELPFSRDEHSDASCRVERTCADAPRARPDPALVRCELGLGVDRMPAFLVAVPSMSHSSTFHTWHLGLWLNDDLRTLATYNSLLYPAVREAVCCKGCGAELSCLNNGR